MTERRAGEDSERTGSRNFVVRAVGVVVALGAVVSIHLMVFHNGNGGAPPAGRSQLSTPLSPFANNDPRGKNDPVPLAVESIAYQRDGSFPTGGWSFVFPQKLQLSTTDLTALNSGNSAAAYED